MFIHLRALKSSSPHTWHSVIHVHEVPQSSITYTFIHPIARNSLFRSHIVLQQIVLVAVPYLHVPVQESSTVCFPHTVSYIITCHTHPFKRPYILPTQPSFTSIMSYSSIQEPSVACSPCVQCCILSCKILTHLPVQEPLLSSSSVCHLHPLKTARSLASIMHMYHASYSPGQRFQPIFPHLHVYIQMNNNACVILTCSRSLSSSFPSRMVFCGAFFSWS